MANLPQVEPEHYQRAGYDTRERFISYWHQADQVLRRAPANVLEIGIGNGFLSRYLRDKGLSVHTLDFDARLEPDTVGSVLALPFATAEFDMACCFETLEHLPYDAFAPALSELVRVARRWVLLSLPDATPYVRIDVETRDRKRWMRRLESLPNPRPAEHRFDGEHYWELGKRGYPVSRITDAIAEAGLVLEESLRVFEMPYHHFLSCRVESRA